MKKPVAISGEQRLSLSKHGFKAKERRQINKEERNKRIGLSEEKIKELERSGKMFLQTMLRANGELFWFHWKDDNNNPLKDPPKGFRFKPYHLNKTMSFLFKNELKESLQNMTDEDKEEPTMNVFLHRRWVIGSKIVRNPEKLHRLGLAL